jgi:hypothetical protein
MRDTTRALLGAAISVVLGLSQEGVARAAPREGIAAVVGERLILVSEVLRYARATVSREEELSKNVLQEATNTLVDRALLELEAKRLHVDVTPAMVDKALANRAKADGVSVSEAIRRSGWSEPMVRDFMRTWLLGWSLLEAEHLYHHAWREARTVATVDLSLRGPGNDVKLPIASEFDRLLPGYLADLRRRGTTYVDVRSWWQ